MSEFIKLIYKNRPVLKQGLLTCIKNNTITLEELTDLEKEAVTLEYYEVAQIVKEAIKKLLV